MQCRLDPQRDRQKIRQQDRDDVQTQCHRQTFHDQRGHAPALIHGNGCPEVPMCRRFQPKKKANHKRFIHVQFLFQDQIPAHFRLITGKDPGRSGAVFPCGPAGKHGAFRGITGCQPHQGITGKQDEEQSECSQSQSFA